MIRTAGMRITIIQHGCTGFFFLNPHMNWKMGARVQKWKGDQNCTQQYNMGPLGFFQKTILGILRQLQLRLHQ
jgi:hypothetical protein